MKSLFKEIVVVENRLFLFSREKLGMKRGNQSAFYLMNCFYIYTVSKTTRELLLEWNQRSPVDLSSDLKMPQFTVESVVTDKCEESSLIGKYL